MTYNNDEPIYSSLTGKDVCAALYASTNNQMFNCPRVQDVDPQEEYDPAFRYECYKPSWIGGYPSAEDCVADGNTTANCCECSFSAYSQNCS